MATKWTKVGSLRKSKAGGLYIKVDADVSLKKDSALNLQDPRKGYTRSVESGKMSQEQADEKISKIPDYIRFDVFLIED